MGTYKKNKKNDIKFRGLDVLLRGSFKIVFYDKDVLSSDDIMCWGWFHSAIAAKEKYIYLERDEIDGAVKDKAYKHFHHDFSLEFWFDTPSDSDSNTINPSLKDWINSTQKTRNRLKLKNRHSHNAYTLNKKHKLNLIKRHS